MSDTATSTTGVTADPPSAATTPAPSPQDAGPANTSPPPSDTTKTESPAPSSGDSRQSDREGLLAAVKSVVQPKAPDPPAEAGDQDAGQTEDREAAPGDSQEGQDKKPDPKTDTADKTDEPLDLNAPDPPESELKKLRPETRRRFERLLAQRNLARTELERVAPELEQHRQLQGYLTQNQLAPDDVNALLSIGASLRKQDYQGFLDGVAPYVIAAQEALGLRVAQDLRQQVDDGTLSEEAAREMTRTRHRAQQAEHRLREQGTQHQAETQSRNVVAVRQAVNTWEQNIRARDPDYALKANAVRRYSQALIGERGIPETAEAAVALTQAAYDEANAEFMRLRPQPQATRRTPSSVHAATNGTGATPAPTSMLDAAKQALAAMRRPA